MGVALVVTTTGDANDCNVFLPSMMRPSGNVKGACRFGCIGSDDSVVESFVLIRAVVVVVVVVVEAVVVAVAVEVDGGTVVVVTFESIIVVPVVVVVVSVVCCGRRAERSIFW